MIDLIAAVWPWLLGIVTILGAAIVAGALENDAATLAADQPATETRADVREIGVPR